MTAKEYLRQAYRLDQKICSDLEEVASLREMASSVSSPQLTERIQTSKNYDAPFVRSLEKIMELGWCDTDAMIGLIVHELGHVYQSQFGVLHRSSEQLCRPYMKEYRYQLNQIP